MPKRIKVGVAIPWVNTYGMRVAEGIARETEPMRSWMVRFAMTNDQAKRLLAWKPDAVILNKARREWADLFRGTGIVSVNWSGSPEPEGMPTVRPDDVAVGRMAARHLLSRGLKHFAYWGGDATLFSRRRWLGFTEALTAAGIPERNIARIDLEDINDWRPSRASQVQTIRELPRPLGMLAVTDAQALYASDMIQDEGLRIPDDVALMGVDNDALFCKMALPRLTSVIMPAFAIGRRVVRLLADILAGKASDSPLVELPPLGVAVRGSTDILAIRDEVVAAALRFVYANADRNISVENVRDACLISRRNLEQRFRKHMGKSPADVIRQTRMERVQYLLLNTEMSVEEIAEGCGFCSTSYLVCSFRREMGITPTQFRKAAEIPMG
ncbi:MAG TPA: substrate-binding domain-containing protein [Phycisphaerae bacterium]|nr:substrate-binding domain-containing protein [Phycisphaerae bacterium]HOI53933.1 substrate-binding domain-containing protein [Phycisphaerae bacterium]